MAITFDGTDDKITWGDIDALDGLTKLTVSLLAKPHADLQNWRCFVGKLGAASGAGSTHGWTIQHSDRISHDLILVLRNGAATHGSTGLGDLSYDAWNHIHMVYDGTQSTNATRLRVWINNNEQTLTFAGTIPATIGANDQWLGFAQSPHEQASWYKGDLAEIAIWGGVAITDTEIISALGQGAHPKLVYGAAPTLYAPLVRDIYDLMGAGTATVSSTTVANHPPVIKAAPIFYSFPVADTTYTLTAGSGSYTKTGQVVALLKGYKVSAGSGSYTKTGTAADLLRGLLLSTAAGSYVLTGTAADLLKDSKISAGSGSYALTGTAADLLKDSKISAGSGSYALTGTAADLLKGLLISADAGAYALTGTAADLLRDLLLSAAGGSYTITGSDVTLTYSQGAILVCDAGSYIISGSAAALKYSRIMPAGSGSYTLAGTAADLLRDFLIALIAGSYTKTGTAADLLRGLLIAAGAGAYTVNGQAVTLTYSGQAIYQGMASAAFTAQKPAIAFTNQKPTITFS